MVVPEEIVVAISVDDVAVLREWFEAVPGRSPEEHDAGETGDYPPYPLLMIAAEQNAVECARYMVSRGADVNYRNPHEFEYEVDALYTALHVAAREAHPSTGQGHPDIFFKILLEAGADACIRTRGGQTPLQYLLTNRNFIRYEILLAAAVRLLLRAGAPLDSIDSAGRAAADVFLHDRTVRSESSYNSYRWIDADPHPCLDLLRGVHAAGGWKPYVRSPHKQLLALRSLRARGRATPGPATPPHVANLTRPSLPNGVVWIVLSYWRPTL